MCASPLGGLEERSNKTWREMRHSRGSGLRRFLKGGIHLFDLGLQEADMEAGVCLEERGPGSSSGLGGSGGADPGVQLS